MVRIRFKQSSKLETKYENSLFNSTSGAMKKLAAQLGEAKGTLQSWQNIKARQWAGFIQESVTRQIRGGTWRKRPTALNEQYRARKQEAKLDTGILRAVNYSLADNLVAEFPGGGVAQVTYAGQSSSPFSKISSSKPRGPGGRFQSAKNYMKTSGGGYKSVMPLANLAALLEFGGRSGRGGTIPPRPFFKYAIEYATLAIARDTDDEVYAALFGGEKQMAELTRRVRAQLRG